MTAHSTLYVDNDSVLVVDGLKDRDGNLIIGAAVSLTAFADQSGSVPSGISLPATFAETGSGRYELALSKDIQVRANKKYLLTIVAIAAGLQGEWTETAIAKQRAA